MKKIFVGNLPWKATEDELKKLFEAFGMVLSVKIVLDQYTGKSKGFGFVEMEESDAAEAAIRELNEKPFLDRTLRVSLALDRPARRDGGNGGGGAHSRGHSSFNGERSYRSRDR
ncbi:putative nucleic acid-binding protein [Chlamydiales bacterium STE3]|nr:putative nucleic acid-binding protein [Chlamydiales bacterium STE3]